MNLAGVDQEAVRLDILHRYHVGEAMAEVAIDDITALAVQLCKTPIAALVFLEAEQLAVASHVGLYLADLPRHLTFCSTLMETRADLVVPDLRLDARFAQHPLVTRFPHLRFYAGVPLMTPDGYLLGALEVLDWEPRTLAPEQLAGLEALARQAMAQLELRRYRLVRRPGSERRRETDEPAETPAGSVYDETLEALARALDVRDGHAPGHLPNLARRVVRLAQRLETPSAELVHIHRGALLHDIGKLAIPDSILLKAGALTDAEWQIVRLHPVYAYEMLLPVEILHPALDIPYSHHERWDGRGYPRGLRGEDIPMAARIFAVMDVWDALSSDRPFRPGWEAARVAEHIRQRAGTAFDPDVVAAFLAMGL
jgi:hypothetical protein